MNQISLLVELQHLDTRSDETAHARGLVETKLADVAELTAARAALQTLENRSAELKSNLRTLELETGALEEKLKQVNERLYSGRITNAKELAGLNEDEKMLRRRKSELEDRELGLMEQIEDLDHQVLAGRAAREKMQSETNARQEQARAEITRLDAADTELAHKRRQLIAQLSPEVVHTYDELRVSKKGRAVAAIKASSCAACGYAVPSGLISRARLGSELVFCANCGRIVAP